MELVQLALGISLAFPAFTSSFNLQVAMLAAEKALQMAIHTIETVGEQVNTPCFLLMNMFDAKTEPNCFCDQVLVTVKRFLLKNTFN